MKKRDLNAPATKRDIDDAVAQIAVVIAKTLEDYATKEDLKRLAKSEDLKRVEDKVDDLAGNVSDIRWRVIDLEVDTVSQREFKEFKAKVLPQ
jgi:hypothetical protein